MKRMVSLLAGVCLLMVLFATPAASAEGVPSLPHAFYGEVEIDGGPAPIGTWVEARVDGVETGISGNPIEVTEPGKYGGPGGFDPKLVVQGDIEEGAIITFYVDDVPAEPTAAWHSGEVTELRLSAETPTPTPTDDDDDGDGVGGPAATYTETDLFGTEERFPINDEGEIQETIVATSEDGMLTITIPEGTICLDIDGEPLESLEAVVDESPPSPPEEADIIGLAYDFGPDGANFDPPISFVWSYDPDDLPEGAAEEDLVIAYYEGDEWVELDCVVDTENKTITASVEHFSIFAIIAARISVVPTVEPLPIPAAFSLSDISVNPVEVESDETVTITVSVANTGGTEGSYTVVLKINDVKEAEKRVTVAAGGSQTLSFSVAREESGSYSVAIDGLSASFTVVAPVEEEEVVEEEEEVVEEEEVAEEEEEVPVKPAYPWPLIGGIIAGVVVVAALLAYFLWYRRRD